MASLEPSLEFAIELHNQGIKPVSRFPVAFSYPSGQSATAQNLRIPGLVLRSITGEEEGPDWVLADATPRALNALRGLTEISEVKDAGQQRVISDVSRTKAKGGVDAPSHVNASPPPPFTGTSGKGTVICVVDASFDAIHQSLRNIDGTTRFLSLWIQGSSRIANSGLARADLQKFKAPPPFDDGIEITQADINYGLSQNPGAGYKPKISQKKLLTLLKRVANLFRTDNRHGTHVCGTAAGNGRFDSGSPGNKKQSDYIGIAPEAALIGIVANDDKEVKLAIRYFRERLSALSPAGLVAGALNLSLQTHWGPHDGRPEFVKRVKEMTIDGKYFDKKNKKKWDVPFVSVISAGNYNDYNFHTEGKLKSQQSQEIELAASPFWQKDESASLQLWAGYGGNAKFKFEILAPGKQKWSPVGTTSNFGINGDFGFNAKMRKWDEDSTMSVLDLSIIRLKMASAAGNWRIRVSRLKDTGTKELGWHLWVKRGQDLLGITSASGTVGPSKSSTYTSDAPGFPVTVGSYDIRGPNSKVLSSFSAHGPRVDGKPFSFLAAPGERIAAPWASALTQIDAGSSPTVPAPYRTAFFESSGTSQAAPHVTGALALMRQVNPKLSLPRLTDILMKSVDARPNGGKVEEWGAGSLNVKAAVDAAKAAT